MIALLLGTHIYLTFRTGFIQRKLPQAIRMSVRRDPSGKGDISSFGALATALAATIGTGSIVGVATALLAGGPGAIFWMWIAGLFGIATKYVETYAAVKYRVRDKSGAMLGGAMFVWKRAFARPDGSVPWWATLGAVSFAAFAVIATIGTGSAVQAAAISGIVTSSVPAIPAVAVAKSVFVYYFEKRTGRQLVAKDGVFFQGTPADGDAVDPIADAIAPHPDVSAAFERVEQRKADAEKKARQNKER